MTRKEFLKRIEMAVAAAAFSPISKFSSLSQNSIVSIVRIKDDDVSTAVDEAIDLLGGIENVAAGKQKIMLKPNLTTNALTDITKPQVIKRLAQLMKGAGKEVSICEGSAAAFGYNVNNTGIYRTWNADILNKMQKFVFDATGYTSLADELGIPLINLHSGEMVEVAVQDALIFDKLSLHHSLTEIDMLCSVPMMKTHTLATVTLGMKNVIGLYSGTVYGAIRGYVHDIGARNTDAGIAFEILDMVRANKMGLTVIDGWKALEGNGPSLMPGAALVDMNLIIAGTDPLATDMIGASVMGFEINEVPTFTWAHRLGMKPATLEEIELRGETIKSARRPLVKPKIFAWKDISQLWGNKVME